jgi:hypothetical protein
MTRLPDWQLRFDSEIQAHTDSPFSWGTVDCYLFAAACVQAITGSDIAKGIRGYATPKQALRLLRDLGGMNLLMSRTLGTPFPAGAAREGDVLLARAGNRPAFAVCTGSGALGPSARGLVHVPRADWLCTWRVG